METYCNDANGQNNRGSGGEALNVSEDELETRIIVDGNVFELDAWSRDKEELVEEGERLLTEGYSGFGFKRIREYVVDESSVSKGVYGLWVR